MVGENVNHYAGFRLRLNGDGLLRSTFYSLDKSDSEVEDPVEIHALTPIEPFILAAFMSQRAILRLETIDINERVVVNRLIVFAKPVFTGFPADTSI